MTAIGARPLRAPPVSDAAKPIKPRRRPSAQHLLLRPRVGQGCKSRKRAPGV